MKLCSIIGLIALSALIGPMAAMAYTINDTGDTAYWGGVVGPNKSPSSVDTIGASFAVNKMDITVTGNTMTVKLYGPWFSRADNEAYSGDLYISSTGWKHTSDSPNFPTDTFTSNEGWNYVVAHPGMMGDMHTQVTKTGVYRLVFDPNTIMTDPTYSGNGGRSDQAYKGGYGDVDPVEPATVTFDHQSGDNSSMTFVFDTPLLQLGDQVGFHWAMYCGNDVVEGEFKQVPEPGTLLLLGLGLAGLAACGKRKK